MDLEQIKKETTAVLEVLLGAAGLQPGDLLVLGCSTSEIAGERIGSSGSFEVAGAVWDGLWPLCEEKGIRLAVQCCEHLNRCLVVEAVTAERFGYDVVCAVPQLHAGGAMASTAYRRMKSPVLVSHVRARAGIDIGLTMIGMHLRDVAVPVRVPKIGCAVVTAARTRPPYVGGERAVYK